MFDNLSAKERSILEIKNLPLRKYPDSWTSFSTKGRFCSGSEKYVQVLVLKRKKI